MGKVLKVLLLSAVFMSCTVRFARGQADRATLIGMVRDSSGAVIPGVTIVATNVATGVQTQSSSSARGSYRIINLPIGEYTVSFRKYGFSLLIRSGIQLRIAQVADINVTLKVGHVSQRVEVKSSAPILQTQTSTLSTTMPNGAVNDLPLDITGGRELESFAYDIVPGVEGNDWTSYIAGTPAFSKEVLIDGTLQQGSQTGSVVEDYPPMDAVQEFTVDTGGASGQASTNTAGGTFMFTLRSGTNHFHGSAFDYIQNEALNANTWMNDYFRAANPSKALLYPTPYDRQTDYGISGGGPLIKDKTFFYAAFEHYSTSNYTLGSYNRTVPTPAFLNGNFSDLLDKSVQLGTDTAGNPIYKGSIFNPMTHLVFPNNIIPSSMISSVSQKIVSIYKQYYMPVGSGLINNDAATQSTNPWFHQVQFSIKMDYELSSRDRLEGSLVLTRRPRILADTGSGVWDSSSHAGGPLAQSRYQNVTSQSWRVSQSYDISPTMLNVASLTFLRYRNPSTAEAASGNWPQTLGFGGTGAGNFPQISFGSSVNGISESPIGYNTSGSYLSNIFVGDEALTWITGRHALTFGGELRAFQLNSKANGGMLNFNFSNAQTGVPTAKYAPSVGFGFASFLLGDVQSASEAVPYAFYGRRKSLSLYSTDSFRVSSRLTLTLGLNWEQVYPWHEKYGHWSNFNTRKINPTLGVPGVVDFAGNGGVSFEGPIRWNDFAPNIGAAYQITPHVVARAAYTMFYEPVGSNYWEGVPYGFAPGYEGSNQVLQTSNFAPAFNWNSGYPGQYVPGKPNPNYLTYGMVSVSPQSLVLGRVSQWNGGVEIELSNHTRLSLNYMGNRGTHLHDGELQNNQPAAGAYSRLLQSGNEWNWVSDPASAAAAGVPYPYAGFSNYAFMALAPFPQVATTYGPIYYVGSPIGTSAYDAFQTEIVQRTSHGLTADVSYNFAHQVTDVSANYGNFQETWSTADLQNLDNRSYAANYIRPWNQSIVKGYISYALPFGKGRRFLTSRGHAVNALLGGWRLGWMLYYSTGSPLSVYSSNYYPDWFGAVYSNITPEVNLSSHFNHSSFDPGSPASSGNNYFDPKAFSNPSYGKLGNSGPYTPALKGFGYASEDVGIYKVFHFGERYRLQLRGEFFNVFNRHYYNNPVTDISSPYFGSVVSVGGPPRTGQVGVRFMW